jgi:hypothetical protein
MNKSSLFQFKKSLLIALVYVGLGTISVLSIYPSSPLYGSWVIFVLFLTLPVNFISVAVMYSDSSAFESILIIQLFYFFVFWFILYYIMKRKALNNKDNLKE